MADKADRKNSSVYLGSEDSPYEGGRLLHNLILFGRLCRAMGLNVTPNRVLEVSRALEHIRLGEKQDFYYTLRAYLVTHPKDFENFDSAFDMFWQRPADGWTEMDLRSMAETRRKKKTQFLPPPGSEHTENDGSQEIDPSLIAITPTFSQQDSLRHKDFAEMTAEELELAKQVMNRLPKTLGLRQTRRFKQGRGRLIDLRKTLRESMRRGGELITLPTRIRRMKPRPVILLCDVSGSMERYTRILLHFMHTLSGSLFQVESFVFSVRLSRITRQIRQKSVDSALKEVGLAVKQWGGGTKTGEALHEFNYQWSRRVLGRGAIVILITDGWDRGDIDLLNTEAARLGRSAKRFIWLNPLLESSEYEPLTRGAQAILPHVDDFLAVRNLANLESIFEKLQQLNSPSTARPFQQKYLFADSVDES